MVQTLQAKNITLRNLIDRFGIQLVDDRQFFHEWQSHLPEVTESEKQQLDKVRQGFLNLLNYPPLLEDVVRMSILDPILFIGGFYLQPFYVRSEKSIEIAVADRDVIITGSLDALVLREEFWILVIESKKVSFSVEEGLAQLLTYMLASRHPEHPSFGMITSGGSFLFVKLVHATPPQYATSRLFGTRSLDDLCDVLSILKRLSNL
ncbi:type I site-specific deoxyribonuclease [Tumidithrix helvetica PCC 7403]|uniref:restriction endonuclease subunit R n=1 Tax=Tumidithrix helvetica TaxID=3457545 RepID=UPI003CA3C27C